MTADAVARMTLLPKPERRGPKPRKPIARGKHPKARRASSLAARKRTLWGLFRAYIYDAHGVYCYTCGAGPLEGSGLQAGHFINAGESLAVRYHPNNVRPQCFRCNINLRGNGSWFGRRLRAEIGDANYEQVFRLSKVIMRLRACDIDEMTEALKRGGVAYETYWFEVMAPRLSALAATAAGTAEQTGSTGESSEGDGPSGCAGRVAGGGRG